MLFNIYIADIINVIQANVFQFADDLCLLKVIYSTSDCDSLQTDLNQIYCYCAENCLKLNANKTEHMRITLKKNISLNNYIIDNISVNTVLEHKNVGVIYDNKLTFNPHIDMIVNKALKKFYTLRHLCKRVNGKAFLNLYKTYILPILEFSNLSIVINETQSVKLEKLREK